MKKIFNIIIDIFIVLLIIVSGIITIISIITNKDGIPSFNGYSPFSIQSNSMYPTIKVGDLIITNSNVDNYIVGDIISYYSYENGKNIIKTHRINQVIEEDSIKLYVTKGDNNENVDDVFITDIDIIGKYTGIKIPIFGYIIDIFKIRWIFFFLILIPLIVLFIYQLIEFIKLYNNYKMDN